MTRPILTALCVLAPSLALHGCAHREFRLEEASAATLQEGTGKSPVVVAMRRFHGEFACTPTFEILLREDGTVEYTGYKFVRDLGWYTWKIPARRVRWLRARAPKEKLFEAAGHIVCDPPGVSIFVRGVTGEEPLFYYDYAETPAEARAYHHYVELVAEAGQHIGPADIWCKPNSLVVSARTIVRDPDAPQAALYVSERIVRAIEAAKGSGFALDEMTIL